MLGVGIKISKLPTELWHTLSHSQQMSHIGIYRQIVPAWLFSCKARVRPSIYCFLALSWEEVKQITVPHPLKI